MAALSDHECFACQLIELLTEVNIVGYQKAKLSNYDKEVGGPPGLFTVYFFGQVTQVYNISVLVFVSGLDQNPGCEAIYQKQVEQADDGPVDACLSKPLRNTKNSDADVKLNEVGDRVNWGRSAFGFALSSQVPDREIAAL